MTGRTGMWAVVVLAGVAALALGGVALWKARTSATAEQQAIATIEKLGGKIFRDPKMPGKPVVGVDLSSTKVSDATLKQLTALKQVRELSLTGPVTDAGLK